MPARAAAAPPSSWMDWRLILASVWLVGVLVLIARIAWASIGLHLAARSLKDVDDWNVLDVLDQASREIGVTRRLRVLVAPIVSAPALMGVLRPKLLLPPAVLKNFNAEELRLIFLHELAHLRRHDVLVNWLSTVLLVVHWFNPIAWLAAARMRQDRELACDERVLLLNEASALSRERRTYGLTILKLLERVSEPKAHQHAGRVPAGVVGILENGQPLKRRIAMIAHFERRGRAWALGAFASMVIIGCVALTDSVKEQPKPQPADGMEAKAQNPTSAARKKPAETQTGATWQLAKDDEITVKMKARREAAAKDFLIHRASEPRRDHDDVDAVTQKLEKRLPEASFDGIPLSEALNWFRDIVDVNLIINTRAIEAAGVDINTPINLKLRDVTAEKLLNVIGEQAGGGTISLGYTIDGNTIKFSTEEDLSRNVFVRAYNVQDLVKSATTRPGAEGIGDALDSLTKVIMDNVAPDTWRDAGGTVGSLNTFGTTLVVKQTSANHREVEKLLEELRSVGPTGVAVSKAEPAAAGAVMEPLGSITIGAPAAPAPRPSPSPDWAPNTWRPATRPATTQSAF